MKKEWKWAVALTLVIFIIGGMCFWAGYDVGEKDRVSSSETSNITSYSLIEGHGGYLIYTGREGQYELRYITGEGWFLIGRDWEPHVMYRLEVWLKDHTPEGHYQYEYFSDGYSRGVFTIYFANK